jgi:hypothetical protein
MAEHYKRMAEFTIATKKWLSTTERMAEFTVATEND